ncbi:hypothetical protein Dimus_027048, partial [Dionaea muscipula]
LNSSSSTHAHGQQLTTTKQQLTTFDHITSRSAATTSDAMSRRSRSHRRSRSTPSDLLLRDAIRFATVHQSPQCHHPSSCTTLRDAIKSATTHQIGSYKPSSASQAAATTQQRQRQE